MIDVRGEKLLVLGVAAETFPGGKRHVSSVHRYRLRGIGGVRLEAVKLGGRWYTSEQAIDRFVAQLNAARSGTDPPSGSPAVPIGFAEAERNLETQWGPTT
jgi:hypothetical protein